MSHPKRDTRTGLLLALTGAALWGLTPVATKVALDGFSPEFLGFARLALAAVFFRLFAGEGSRWFVHDFWICIAGAGLGADFLLYNYGIQRTSANVAGLVVNVELLSTIAFAVWLLGERLTRRRMLGGAITLGGVLIVTLEGVDLSDLTQRERILGNLLVMAAGICWSLFAVAQRRTTFGRNLFQRLTPIFSIAAVISAPVLFRRSAWIFAGGIRPTVMFIVLTVFGTGVVYWVYARAQQLIDMSALSILLCTMPIFTILFADLFLHEPLTARILASGAIVVTGITTIAAEHSP